MKKICSVPGCWDAVAGLGYCNRHYQSAHRYGDPMKSKQQAKRGSGSATASHGYHVIGIRGRLMLSHRAIAEKALGAPLPPAAVVHHVDGNRLNNEPSNLVICPNEAYHRLLHRRMRALFACGNAAFIRCRFCGKFDDPSNLYMPRADAGYHRACRQLHRKDRA